MTKKLNAAGGYDLGGSRMQNAGYPSATDDMASKRYVDDYDLYPLSEYGFLGGLGDVTAFNSVLSTGNGELQIARCRVRAGVAVTNLYVACAQAGIFDGVDLAQNRLAVYDDSGTLLSMTANNNALYSVSGYRGGPLATPVPAQSTSRFVYLGVLAGGQAPFPDSPRFAYMPSSNLIGPVLSHPDGKRRGIFLAGQTTFPTSFNPYTYGEASMFYPLMTFN